MMKQLMQSVLIGLAVAAAGCAGTRADGNRSETAGQLFDDATTTTAVKSLIVGDPDAHLFRIEVTTTRGDVLLQGIVNTREAEERLVNKIRAMRGVRSVRSVLSLEEKKAS
jgi:osmotically-inducible protein OsmY